MKMKHKKSFVSIILVISVLALAFYYYYTTVHIGTVKVKQNNIIKNGSFEDKSEWVFSDWTTPWTQEDRGYVLDANGYEGNCLKITSEANENFQQRISFPAGTSSNPLYFSFKYKIEGDDFYAVVLYVPEHFGIWLIHDQKGYRIGKECVEFSKMTILRHIDVGRGWKQVDVSVETSPGSFCPFRIYPNPAPNYLYIDDLYLGTEDP
jgi:hypothetical protein